jgi:hypothetical protein
MCNLAYLEERRRNEERDYFGDNRFFLHQKHVAFQMAHVRWIDTKSPSHFFQDTAPLCQGQ